MRYLVIHDVDAIRQYVFATNRLREIRGASALIDRINTRDIKKLVKSPDKIIYVGGGGVAADFANDKDAYPFSQEVSVLYSQYTITASSTGVVQDYDENAPDDDVHSFSNALALAHRRLREKKASRLRETQLITSPYFKRCEACGIYPATKHDTHYPPPPEKGSFICESCSQKRQHRSDANIDEFIRREFSLPPHNIRFQFPRELDDIGKGKGADGYMGVIYADGNRMGGRFEKMRTETALENFSEVIDQATREVISSVMLKRILKRRENLLQNDVLHALVPLCGGDDLVVVTPGHQALQIAVEYLEAFQSEVRKKMSKEVKALLGSREVSACAGVVIAKSHTPISALVDLAHDLCKSAKQRNYKIWQEDGREEPCVDFQVITTPNWRELKETREQQFLLRPDTDRYLTCRPYTTTEARDLINAVDTLKKQKFPPSKLHELYLDLWKGRGQAILKYLTLYVRARESRLGPKQKTALLDIAKNYLHLEQPPWRKSGQHQQIWETPYADLVEIYPFINE